MDRQLGPTGQRFGRQVYSQAHDLILSNLRQESDGSVRLSHSKTTIVLENP
jgi:hypothetical protein